MSLKLDSVANIVPNYGFMIDAHGNKVESIYKTPRQCIRCGEMFLPRKRTNGMPTIPDVCSPNCGLDKVKRLRVEPSASELASGDRLRPHEPSLSVPSKAAPERRPKPAPSRGPDGKFSMSKRNAAIRRFAGDGEGFGPGLRRRRVDRGWRASDLAERLGCSTTGVLNWENGAVVIPADRLAALAKIFDCTMEDLWYDRR